jgi:DNA-binding transcriptional LysR family regulator
MLDGGHGVPFVERMRALRSGCEMDESSDVVKVLDVRQLVLLDALYATQSVTKTAERLGQTQPAVSILLRQLRTQLRDPLFVRTSRGMRPTPRTEVVVSKAREILSALRELADDRPRFDPLTSKRVFRICVPDSSHITMLPQLLLHMREAAPGVRFEILTVGENSARLLEDGKVDLAISGFLGGIDASYYQQALFDQDFVCLARSRHPRLKKAGLTLKAYVREAHIEVTYGWIHELINNEMKRQNIERRVHLTVPGFLGLAAVIAVTDMIATLPRGIGTALANSKGLQLLRCPVQLPKYKVKQFWHSRFHLDPGNQWLRSTCAVLYS